MHAANVTCGAVLLALMTACAGANSGESSPNPSEETTAATSEALGSSAPCVVGEVKMFAGNFTPSGWLPAQGQVLPISQNTALFSILGTTFGGDGHTTFALPNLSSRAPIATGPGVRLGQALGSIPPQQIDMPGRFLGIGFYVCAAGVFPSSG